MKAIRFWGILPLVLIGVTSAPSHAADKFQLIETDEGVTVEIDGELFTRYVTLSGTKPILWPIIGPTGDPVTRQFPMADAGPGEKADHPHHRSLWFTHGDVNGLSYWHEPSSGKSGTIRHRRFLQIRGGDDGKIVTANDWVNDQGVVVCTDRRTVRFATETDHRLIDFSIAMQAGHEPVKLGDTKEGSFGIRVAGAMKVDAGHGGRIVNQEGLTDAEAWGKPSAWVDYHGPVKEDGPVIGVAILNHPSSFRFPTYWHVRTYGLFAANPFGLHNFLDSREVDGSHEMAPGTGITLRYRVVIHNGDHESAGIAQAFADYASVPFTDLDE